MNTLTRLAIAALIASGSAANAGQFSLDFEHYTGFQGGPDPLAGLSFTIDANETDGYADFTVSLDPNDGVGTLTKIWFEQGSGLGSLISTANTGQVNLAGSGGGPNPAGANGELSWLGTFDRHAKQGNVRNGVDAGESFTMRYAAGTEFFTSGLNALLSGDARIAFHLQRLGNNANKSAHYASFGSDSNSTTAVPLPATGALAGAGLLAVGSRRRR